MYYTVYSVHCAVEESVLYTRVSVCLTVYTLLAAPGDKCLSAAGRQGRTAGLPCWAGRDKAAGKVPELPFSS